MADTRLRAQYSKLGDLRFISHLDLVRLMERAINRARLPIAYSEGFHPKPKIAYGPALALGITSQVELADFQMAEEIEVSQFVMELNRVLPKGAQINKAMPIPEGEKALTAEIEAASYGITLDPKAVSLARTPSELCEDILNQETILVSREKKGRTRRVDIRPFIIALQARESESRLARLEALIQVGSGGATNPRELLSLLDLDLAQPGVRVERTGLFRRVQGELVELI